MGGRIADVDSGALLAYRDPALFGGWGYWQLQGNVQRQVIPEYDPTLDYANTPIRESRLTSYGAVFFSVGSVAMTDVCRRMV